MLMWRSRPRATPKSKKSTPATTRHWFDKQEEYYNSINIQTEGQEQSDGESDQNDVIKEGNESDEVNDDDSEDEQEEDGREDESDAVRLLGKPEGQRGLLIANCFQNIGE